MTNRKIEIRTEGGSPGDSDEITCNVSINIGAVPIKEDLEFARTIAISLVDTIRQVIIEELEANFDVSDLSGSIVSVSFSGQASDGANFTENRPIIF